MGIPASRHCAPEEFDFECNGRSAVKKLISMLTVSTALIAAPAAAQIFDEWDADADEFLSPAEFEPGLETTGWFGEWDENEDDLLAEEEFETGLFGVFDDNDDDALSVDEWDQGIDAWYGEETVNFTFSNWDDDGDGVLSRDEFTDALGATGLYGGFAGYNQELTQAEFDEGLVDWYDDDDDDLLGEDEWDPLFGLLD